MKKLQIGFMLALIVVVSNQSFAQAEGSASSQSAAPDLSKAPFRNPALPIEQRVNDLVSRRRAVELATTTIGVERVVDMLEVEEDRPQH